MITSRSLARPFQNLLSLLLAFAVPAATGAADTVAPVAPLVETRSAVSSSEGGGFGILQINDVYKVEGLEGRTRGGLGRVRTLRAALESAGKPVLVMLAGDFLFPSVMSKYFRGGPITEGLNRLDGSAAGFDENLIVTFGNHEFDDRDPGVVLGRIAQSDFVWLSTNVRYRTAKDAPPEDFARRLRNVRTLEVRDLGGIRVGIFALTLDDQPQEYTSYSWTEETRRALTAESLHTLQGMGAEFIVALTHQNLDQDIALARAFPEIGLVVGGHEHIFLERRVGDTWVTKADADAKSAIVHDITRGPDGRVRSSHRKVMLDSTIEPDPMLEAYADIALSRLATAIQRATGRPADEVLATTQNALEGVEPAIRGRETAMGNLLTDALRAKTGANIAFINGGAVRINDDIPAGGSITGIDLEGIFYFDNAVVATEVTGAQLLDLLRISVSGAGYGHGRFLQVSGLRFRYEATPSTDPNAAETTRIEAADVEIARPDGSFEPLDSSRRYTAATLDYLWEFGFRDGYPLFSRGRGTGYSSPPRYDDAKAPRMSWRAVTEEYLATLPDRRVTTAIEGRIVRVETP